MIIDIISDEAEFNIGPYIPVWMFQQRQDCAYNIIFAYLPQDINGSLYYLCVIMGNTPGYQWPYLFCYFIFFSSNPAQCLNSCDNKDSLLFIHQFPYGLYHILMSYSPQAFHAGYLYPYIIFIFAL